MQAKAKLRHLHIAPRKVRLVINQIRGLDAEVALNRLDFIEKGASKPVAKLLNSALANAEHNFDLDKKNLYIKEIRVDEGPKFRRWQPRAFGRAYPVLKRTSHVTIVLEEKVPTKKGKKPVKKVKERKVPKAVEPVTRPFRKKDRTPPKPRKERREGAKIFDRTREASRRHKEHQDKQRLAKQKSLGRIKGLFRRKSV